MLASMVNTLLLLLLLLLLLPALNIFRLNFTTCALAKQDYSVLMKRSLEMIFFVDFIFQAFLLIYVIMKLCLCIVFEKCNTEQI